MIELISKHIIDNRRLHWNAERIEVAIVPSTILKNTVLKT
jgi:hypothetical protein